MKKTLIITDVQHDFMPGSILGVPHANEIIPIINRIVPEFDVVVATLDWHPEGHVSFASRHGMQPGEEVQIGEVRQILWPDHCIQNTRGAELAHGLFRDRISGFFRKGIDPNVDSYSVFYDNERHRSTGLEEFLRKNDLHELYFVGVATDYCVLYSVLDALEIGFDTTVIRDACRAINRQPEDEERALEQMRRAGAKVIFSSEVSQQLRRHPDP